MIKYTSVSIGDSIMNSTGKTVKSTININEVCYEEIKKLVAEEEVKSLTQAINDAIALYLKEIKRRKYAEGMMEAAKDPDFIKENEQIEKEFDGIDAEVEGEW